MLGDGIGHGFAFTVVPCIVAAHGALQLGELAHHAGEQVGLGQLRSPFGICHRGARGGRQGGSQPADALAALGLGAQPGVVDHLGQLRQPRGQRLAPILVEEELGIGQARAHHALVAVDDAGRIVDAHVGDDQELVLQLAAGLEQREIALVGAHAENQAFLRHGQEGRVELAGVDGRPFHQCRHFVQQGRDLLLLLVVDGQDAAVLLAGVGQLVGDHHAARLVFRLDMALLAQLTGVAVGVFQRDGAAGQEAVAVGDAVGRQTQYRAGQHAIAVQHHQPVGRTHEADGGEPVGQLVGHELGNGQLRQGLDDDLADDIGQHGAGLCAAPVEDVLLAVVPTGERRDLGPLFLGPFDQGLGGLAFGIQAHGNGRPLDLDLAGIGLGANAGQVHGQPARGGVDVGSGVFAGQQLTGGQPRADALGEAVGQPGEGVRRQLFGQQLDQQGGVVRGLVHGRAPSLAWSSAVIIGKPSRSRDS